MGAIGEGADRGEKLGHFARTVGMAEDGSAKVASEMKMLQDNFERFAGGIGAALVVAGAHHGEAFPLHLDLRRADDVAGGHEADVDIADAGRGRRRARAGAIG